MRNVFLDQVRNAGREFAAPKEEPKAESGADWDYHNRLISALTVRAAMARLAPLHREIVALVDIAGFSYGEAATILEVPRGTVMSRLSRARGALLDHIAEGNILPLEGRRVRK